MQTHAARKEIYTRMKTILVTAYATVMDGAGGDLHVVEDSSVGGDSARRPDLAILDAHVQVCFVLSNNGGCSM